MTQPEIESSKHYKTHKGGVSYRFDRRFQNATDRGEASLAHEDCIHNAQTRSHEAAQSGNRVAALMIVLQSRMVQMLAMPNGSPCLDTRPLRAHSEEDATAFLS